MLFDHRKQLHRPDVVQRIGFLYEVRDADRACFSSMSLLTPSRSRPSIAARGGSRLPTWATSCCSQEYAGFDARSIGHTVRFQVIVLFPSDSQLILATCVACCYMALLLCRRPYVRARDDTLALVAQTNVVLLLLVGHLLRVSAPLEVLLLPRCLLCARSNRARLPASHTRSTSLPACS